MKYIKEVLVSLVMVLAGCGGGSSDSTQTPTNSDSSTIVVGKTIVDYGNITSMSSPYNMYRSDITEKSYRIYTDKSCLWAGNGYYTYEHYDVYFEVYADNTMATLWTETKAGEIGVCNIREVYESTGLFDGTSLTIKRTITDNVFLEPATDLVYYITTPTTNSVNLATMGIPDYNTEKTFEVIGNELIQYAHPDYNNTSYNNGLLDAHINKILRLESSY